LNCPGPTFFPDNLRPSFLFQAREKKQKRKANAVGVSRVFLYIPPKRPVSGCFISGCSFFHFADFFRLSLLSPG